MKPLLVSLALLFGLLAMPAPAQANPGHTYLGWSAQKTAAHIGCRNFYRIKPRTGSHDSGICYLNGYRVNVITFKTHNHEATWGGVVLALSGPRFWAAFGNGAVVVAKNGNRAAAAAGARALPGKMINGDF